MKLFLSEPIRRQLGIPSDPGAFRGSVEIRTAQESRDVAYRLKLIAREKGVSKASPSGGTLLGLALLEEVWHRLIGHYQQGRDSRFLGRTLEVLSEQIGREALLEVLDGFAVEFLASRPTESSNGGSALQWQAERQEVLNQLVVFWMIHSNPAAGPQIRLLQECALVGKPAYARFTAALEAFLASLPGFDENDESLLATLLAPYREAPSSIGEQLRFLLQRWGKVLGGLTGKIQQGIDVIAEEEDPGSASGAGPAQRPLLVTPSDGDEVSYSQDRDWMPEMALVAKNVVVWLDQLSKAYDRPIERLDEIPDQSLEELARCGFTGLWLIGIWERSPASDRIRRFTGDPEAAASAYSPRRYQVAQNLGGDTALDLLVQRASRYGIRLAANMVPSHTGIDSDWLLDYPDWFLGESNCPFPDYSFEGPDLSPSPEVGIFLEDHCWDRSEAAVVFKRFERSNGESRFIYHGNDGVSTPWNDTAQLDYLNAELRDAVIDTIVGLAHRFPVVRFDAATTLAKRQFQRLWYPEAGDEATIASRAERGLSRAEFDRHMPTEFWREVVDRVSLEAPDTLLMAEAHRMMEGYFVRTLGMHRVDNGAFMKMLRDRKNAEYRALIKETLEYDPRILERHVNFMSDPGGATAVEQFGRGDFYFGVCTLMATLPGLPMFGHGQVEGLAEKYDMESTQAHEQIDEAMAARHQSQIAPLLRRREVFAGVDNFRFFDGLDEQGEVCEDVFAYSNGTDEERLLVVFNSGEAHARVRLHESVPFRDSTSSAGEGSVKTSTLGGGLRISNDKRLMVRFRDSIAGNEYLLRSEDLHAQGLEVELGPFQSRVFEDFADLWDMQGRWRALAFRLAGRGVASLQAALRELELEPLQIAFEEALSPALIGRLLELPEAGSAAARRECHELLRSGLGRLMDWIARRWSLSRGHEAEAAAGAAWLTATMSLLEDPEVSAMTDQGEEAETSASRAAQALRDSPEILVGLAAWTLIQAATEILRHSRAEAEMVSEWHPSWQLGKQLASMGVPLVRARGLAQTLDLALRRDGMSTEPPPTPLELLGSWLSDEETRRVLDVHRYEAEEFLRQEALEILLRWHFLQAVGHERVSAEGESLGQEARLETWWRVVSGVTDLAAESEYRVRDLLDRINRAADA